ncbi:hypothetical protein G6F55_007152 [Rhizopus delemar]|uniref:SGNH hydrolase-type esterase domain-containing protein n=2 Tax=Rhizopus TaxID=4842 RepID=A0A9P7CKT3_9FUNG|nr:hypothetical protein G6F43_008864 [Rhizopus delemar]KAG1542012.1 hypothetical protein G6F51_007541 [Rhizopus arrhizus]KAG1455297.1 hypothetical protein G6F55_007152 [Rhizopus delemar]KAG1565586.1 hypothetical protein G6F50_009934 [Rhizopus delemar]KAG1579996.1 hypothetical protein G6F48_010752 [Rhizopus delemar]
MYWHTILLLSFFILNTLQQQVVLTNSAGLIQPFTYEWVHILEQLHNTFGNRSKSEKKCLHQIPKFKCKPFYWEDSITNRDAYHLRPIDIKSVIAIGDSMTAGFGMMSGRPPFSTILEYRGKVFSVGGDEGEYTIPNFLSVYSDVQGPPEGITLPLSKGKKLNSAITGAKTQDLNQEVERLIHLLNTKEYRQVKDEWKVITLFIGANNVCVLCTPPVTRLPDLSDADIFENNIRLVLERLRTEVGKSFINLVGLFNVSSVYEATRGDSYCEMIWDPSYMMICSCIQQDEQQRQGKQELVLEKVELNKSTAADRLIHEYNLRLQKLEKEFKFKDKEQFGVSYQPAFTQFPVAKYKQAYFSGIDW